MVFWVFGYGSLVWNPGFEYDEKVIGFIKDYRRVFDLACTDHRGTPEYPARTCMLEPKEGAICWGVALCVRGGPKKERMVMEYLERRECEYDQKTFVSFYEEGDSSKPALTGVILFISSKENKYYLGPVPLEDMSRQIATAYGPCGNNRDYVFLLEKAMYNIGHEDNMVIELANEVRKVVAVLDKKKLVGREQLATLIQSNSSISKTRYSDIAKNRSTISQRSRNNFFLKQLNVISFIHTWFGRF
ncbi:unnamed protein product [Vicia faba]|uniref:glutathione-specific gamma-glutamylcyclotransferase n=1 Tax=Vicia faba TaxID=3906 RepID=A0AAV1AA01_VICFA|nr:unnamed protein product [Vicia faba]